MKENNNCLEKEIDLIQGYITHMTQNSFEIKGWLIDFETAFLH